TDALEYLALRVVPTIPCCVSAERSKKSHQQETDQEQSRSSGFHSFGSLFSCGEKPSHPINPPRHLIPSSLINSVISEYSKVPIAFVDTVEPEVDQKPFALCRQAMDGCHERSAWELAPAAAASLRAYLRIKSIPPVGEVWTVTSERL